MVYALILSFLSCGLALLAFGLVAQPERWIQFWRPHRRLILAADHAESHYSQTGIRVRLGMFGGILAVIGAAIPLIFITSEMDNPLGPQRASAAVAVPHAPDVQARPATEDRPEVRGANAIPAQAACTDAFLPAPEPAKPYTCRFEAQQEFDPTLAPWAIEAALLPVETDPNNIP